MATKDISRLSFDSLKHYSSVRMQQGRIIIDDDWNENERIENEDRRRARVEIVGPSGSPDQGFRIDNLRWDSGFIDFDILDGSFYIGGLRLEIDQKETYRLQKDWLQQMHDLHPDPGSERFDLVYLEAWQQPVGAVEDNELFEVALGGPDTSMRIRNMRRVRLKKDVQTDNCNEAWQKLVEDWKVNKKGTLNKENERVPDASLQVTFAEGGNPDDLCTPLAAGGYLGAENQAIRVQIVDQAHLTWGFDNAAPLYRVSVNATGETVILKTDPKDQAHWPLAGQTVEILPWSAVLSLPKGEKIAEIKGHLSKVKSSYNPDTGELTLATPVLADFGKEWTLRSDAGALEEPLFNFYMRIWNRGSDQTSPDEIPFAVGTPLPLGNTGLEITITGDDHVSGDYWIIAARPETPNKVVPWKLEEGLSPHGIRRFYAPLALIHWKLDGSRNTQGAIVSDCRDTFRPLTKQRMCCTFIVGDGKSSHGDFNSIEEAVRHLPRSGGEICLLPGRHEANVLLEGKHRIKFRGCGEKTIITPRVSKRETPIFSIEDSEDITLDNMYLVALQGTAVVLEGTEEVTWPRKIEICHTAIHAYKHAIRVEHGADIKIHNNKIRMLDKEEGDVAIYVLAEDCVIERNEIDVIPANLALPPDAGDGSHRDPTDPCIDMEVIYDDTVYFMAYLQHVLITPIYYFPFNSFRVPGGIQIAGGSERIKVLENRITGGSGNGITLGSNLDLTRIFGEEEEDGATIEHTDGIIGGRVMHDSKGLRNFTLLFESSEGRRYQVTTRDDYGNFEASLPAGNYAVFAASPMHRIDNIVIDYEEDEFGIFHHQFNVVKRELDFTDILAFICDIHIERNEIAKMGLSGIGIPHITPSEQSSAATPLYISSRQMVNWLEQFLSLIGNPIIALGIYRNHITDCLQGPSQLDLGREMRLKGFGGISLGMCEDLFIHENRIENNGINHIYPVCGIFITCGEHVEIARNHIVNNGPLVPELDADMEQGIRGGIVVRALALRILSLIRARRSPISMGGMFAARVHDNVVDQPVGQALRIWSWGPVSILDNRFNSEFAGPGTFDQSAGAVFVFNMGMVSAGEMRQAKAKDSSNNFTRPQGATQFLPGSDTLFNNNQTRLGSNNNIATSQLIVSRGDLGFDGNQSEVWGIGIMAPNELILPTNTILCGTTLRATDSRFWEPMDPERNWRISLLTLTTLMNITMHNQGNHCIIAYPLRTFGLLDKENQVWNEEEQSCDDLLEFDFMKMIEEIDGRELGAVKSVKDSLSILRFLLKYERARSEKQWGKENLRTKLVEEQLKHNFDVTDNLEVESELAKIKVPDVGENDALIHGRVFMENHRGIMGLNICMMYKKRIVYQSSAETDASGYYAFVINPEALKQIQPYLKRGVQIAVTTKKGALIYLHKPLLKIAEGDRKLVEIVLTGRDLRSGKKPKKPPTKKGKKVKPAVLEDIPGIGPISAKKLRAAGIKEVKDFVKADDAKLRKILGNINVSEMKKKGMGLLKR